MRKISIVFVAFLLVVAGFSNIFAQKTSSKPNVADTYNDSDFYKLQDAARRNLDERVFRQTTITEKLKIGSRVPLEYSKNINEKLPPDRSRFIAEKKTEKGVERTEYINIGRERYIRENNGEWRIYKPESGGSGGGSGSGSGDGDSKVEYTEEKKFVRGEKVNKQKVDRYEQILRYTFTYPNKVEKVVKTDTHWFNSDGLLVKKSEEWRNETDKTINRTTEVYEYDIPLKIEKPTIKNTVANRN